MVECAVALTKERPFPLVDDLLKAAYHGVRDRYHLLNASQWDFLQYLPENPIGKEPRGILYQKTCNTMATAAH